MMENAKAFIAKRVAKELKDGYVVNLGIGLPTLVPNYLPEDVEVILQSENGFVGLGGAPDPDKVDMHVTDAGGTPTTIKAGGAFFDSAASFCLIRGGHVDVTILGAMQVDEKGDIANYKIPGKMVAGMGGAMDLLVGAKEVIVAMEHTNKGKHKILEKCTLPLTAKGENGTHIVDMIITEMGVMEVREDGIWVTELHPDYTKEDIQAATECELHFDPNMKAMEEE